MPCSPPSSLRGSALGLLSCTLGLFDFGSVDDAPSPCSCRSGWSNKSNLVGSGPSMLSGSGIVLLSSTLGPLGSCFFPARYSRVLLQHCSQRALFGLACSRWHLVHRPRSLASSRLSRSLLFFPSLLTSGSMGGVVGILGGGHSPGSGFMTTV